jgi:hypothetical protein
MMALESLLVSALSQCRPADLFPLGYRALMLALHPAPGSNDDSNWFCRLLNPDTAMNGIENYLASTSSATS